ncbi:hypothetical protein M0805_003037 [Coniferiporia weirii]|nr:hypothetical protein M0805_003037 [Coniferiporia weirii]
MQCVRRASLVSISPGSSAPLRRFPWKRCLHASRPLAAISKFAMPAMSPTMTEGGIAQWKKKEGEAFSAGDVLLEVETDKATIDVEAQDDGILGKILAPDGAKNVTVGKTIALIAEEGDDITNLQVPEEDTSKESKSSHEQPTSSKPAQTPAPSQQPLPKSSSHGVRVQHSRPLFPSVQRLLLENGVEDADKIKGTGIRGMLTKGDVLSYLGKASSPLGTYRVPKPVLETKKAKESPEPLNGQSIRRLIVSNLSQSSLRARSTPSSTMVYDFDSVVADYLPPSATPPRPEVASPKRMSPTETYFDGLI